MPETGDNSKTALIEGLNGLLADHLALYVKTKNFHWHVTGPRFRDLHLLFDEQAVQIQGQVDAIGERVRKNNALTLTSIGSVARATQVKDQDDATLAPERMIEELRDDNARLVERLREVKGHAGAVGDNATDSMIDDWTDMAQERVWFLSSFLK